MPSTVSVVVPTYNNELTISETLESIMGQDYPRLEVIISDHHSSDNTVARVTPWLTDPRITFLEGPEERGAEANWNFVTDKATGDYIVLVCGDDLLLPDSLRKRAEILDTHPSVVMVSSKKSVIGPDGTVLIPRRGLGGMSGQYSGAEAVKRSVRIGQNLFGEPMNVMFRRVVWETCGPWRGQDPYVIDLATYFSFLAGGDFFALPDVLSSFRVSKDQLSYRLVSDQARQVRRLHRDTRQRFPDSVSRLDVARGNTLATINAQLRRMVYATIQQK